jgi:hypothetical protein
MSWYTDAIKARWNDPEVQKAILDLFAQAEEPFSEEIEGLIDVETAVFGPRVECPWDCGSLLLVGAPECWGCDNGVTWEGRTVTKGQAAPGQG